MVITVIVAQLHASAVRAHYSADVGQALGVIWARGECDCTTQRAVRRSCYGLARHLLTRSLPPCRPGGGHLCISAGLSARAYQIPILPLHVILTARPRCALRHV